MSYPPLPSNGETQWGDKFRAWADALEGRADTLQGRADTLEGRADTLQGSKVTGTDMTLRTNTSAGTRVFLDHPGGSTMIYGDTGWRAVQDLLAPGWELDTTVGYFRLRRTIHTTEMLARLIVTPDAAFIDNLRSATHLITTLPYGFGVFPTYAPMGAASSRGEHVRITADGPYRMQVSGGTGTWVAGDSLTFTLSAPPQANWPTTLPGEPV